MFKLVEKAFDVVPEDYPTPNPIIHFKKELEGYKTSKGAIQFTLDKPLPLSFITRIVKFRLEEDTKL